MLSFAEANFGSGTEISGAFDNGCQTRVHYYNLGKMRNLSQLTHRAIKRRQVPGSPTGGAIQVAKFF
jgi:hypothetical protein